MLSSAFLDEPVSLRIYQGFSPEKRLRNLTADFLAELDVCLRYGSPLQSCEDGKVVGAAVIYPPGSLPLPWHISIQMLVKSILGHDFYDIRPWLRWQKETAEIHPQAPHYYLQYLGVAPERQGQGFGSAILREITAQADQAGTGCYLETATIQNVPLYQRHGFQVIAEKDLIGLHTWFMWRPAGEAG